MTINRLVSPGRTDRRFLLALATLVALTLVAAVIAVTCSRDSLSTAQPRRANTAAIDLVAAESYSGTSLRLRAYYFAVTQRGKPYRYGADGLASYDCSGLVYRSYLHVGMTIPRDTYGMLRSSRLVRVSRPQKGDLAFYGSGHVEFYVSGGLYSGLSFGAEHSGTNVKYRSYNRYYHPSMFVHVRGAG